MRYEDLDILFLTKIIPDYLHDALFLGLQQLGCNVVDYPRKGSLHGIAHPSEFHCEQLLFNLPTVELRHRPDLMIVTLLMHTTNPLGPEGWINHVRKTEQDFNPLKIAALDSSDKQETFVPELRGDYCALFKREMFEPPHAPLEPSTGNWVLFPLMPTLESFVYRFYEKRDLDFTYMAAPSNSFRSVTAEFLKKLAEKHRLKAVIHCGRPVLPRHIYLENLSRSRCSVSVKGMGYDCYRYWELPARGTVMVAQDVGLPYQNDFTEEHCFKFKELQELGEAILKVREMSCVDLDLMAYRALQHVSLYHTPRKRAEMFLKHVFGEEISA